MTIENKIDKYLNEAVEDVYTVEYPDSLEELIEMGWRVVEEVGFGESDSDGKALVCMEKDNVIKWFYLQQ